MFASAQGFEGDGFVQVGGKAQVDGVDLGIGQGCFDAGEFLHMRKINGFNRSEVASSSLGFIASNYGYIDFGQIGERLQMNAAHEAKADDR